VSKYYPSHTRSETVCCWIGLPFHLTHFEISLIGCPRANDEVGMTAREWP